MTTGSYVRVELVPEFPGGQYALSKVIQKNLRRPSGPKQHGRVFVNFTVLASGDITDVRVAPGRGMNEAYDAAAVECIRRLPKFSPGKRDGEPIAMATTVPVDFP
jgi:protein TonB